MALMVAPREACDNLELLAADGREGTYGFYEAVDYTPSRLPPHQSSVTIRSFMAHHQGMSLLALAYRLLDRPCNGASWRAPPQSSGLAFAGARAPHHRQGALRSV